MRPTYLMLLWHMHQPYYKDLAEGVYTMPWVRLHALKDYYGMVAMLREYPSVRMTFNLVPSLLAQLEDYALDRASGPAYETTFKPAAKLAGEERENLMRFAFQVNREHLLNRHPRFRELWEKAGGVATLASAQLLSAQDVLDLQVLSQLAWFDEISLGTDPDIRSLLGRGRGYREADKVLLRRKEVVLFNKALEEYKSAAERGQIEISTSPFYHPILPLLCDSNVAAESHPGVSLPRRRFRHPEDARHQLREAVALHVRLFGRRPQGLWPSEGSVSDEALGLAAEEGFRWAATDEGVLGRSLQMGFSRRGDGTVSGGEELYRPHRFSQGGREISLFFRDHQLSDLIGFVYSRMDPEAAATDLIGRIRAVGRSAGARPGVVSIILDGENAWEFYPGNGREFLKRFYDKLARDPEIRAVTASEALGASEPGRLDHVVPGSWINANFDIWIGAEEDNRAWDLLSAARDFYAENSGRAGIPSAQVELARQELAIAEGSDWCWWYGPEHSSAYDQDFDLLYRKHLSNIYRLLGGSPPDELAVPIKRPRAVARHTPPSGRIEPSMDGVETSYFEWLGAGVYVPEIRSGSMHAGSAYVEALYYGYASDALFLRLDLNEAFRRMHPEFEVRVNIDGETPARLQAPVAPAGVGPVQFAKGNVPMEFSAAGGAKSKVAFGRIFELRLDYQLLNVAPGGRIRLQVSLWVNGLPVQIIPQEGWLALELAIDPMTW